MPIKPPNRRIEKWNIKVNPETIKEHFQRHKSHMNTYYTAAAEYFYDKEIKTKQILDSQGVLPSLYPMYYNFTRELGFKIYYVGLSGPALTEEARYIRDKWMYRGLDEVILNTIALDVFGIVIPA